MKMEKPTTRSKKMRKRTKSQTRRLNMNRLMNQLHAREVMQPPKSPPIRLRVAKVPQMKLVISKKLKRPKSINLKRILEKTPESMRMLKKAIRIIEVGKVKSAREVVERKAEAVVAVDVAIRTRIWSTDPKLRTSSHRMLQKRSLRNKMPRLMQSSTRCSKLQNQTQKLMKLKQIAQMLRPSIMRKRINQLAKNQILPLLNLLQALSLKETPLLQDSNNNLLLA